MRYFLYRKRGWLWGTYMVNRIYVYWKKKIWRFSFSNLKGVTILKWNHSGTCLLHLSHAWASPRAGLNHAKGAARMREPPTLCVWGGNRGRVGDSMSPTRFRIHFRFKYVFRFRMYVLDVVTYISPPNSVSYILCFRFQSYGIHFGSL